MTDSLFLGAARRWAIAGALIFPIQWLPTRADQSYPQRFDLICHGTAFTAFRPYPHTRGTGEAYSEKPWPDDQHFIVDPTTKQFCIDKDCSGGGHRPLAKVEGDRIFFRDELGLHESVDLKTRKYVRQVEVDEGEIQAARDTCRFAPFSGFRW
jgi:hypothetical protein